MFEAVIHRRMRRTTLPLAATVMLVPGATGIAQSGNATLQGTITDPSGAAIPGAQIHVIATQTGVARDIVSNGDGFYSAPNLSAATYRVSVQANIHYIDTSCFCVRVDLQLRNGAERTTSWHEPEKHTRRARAVLLDYGSDARPADHGTDTHAIPGAGIQRNQPHELCEPCRGGPADL